MNFKTLSSVLLRKLKYLIRADRDWAEDEDDDEHDYTVSRYLHEEMQKFDDFRTKYWERKPNNMEGAETEIAYIISSHLYLEQMINNIISHIFPNPEKIIKSTFAHKVKIIEALDILSDESIGYINALNSIRNKFAHNLDYETSFNEAKLLAPGIKKKSWDSHSSTRLRILYWAITDAISHISISEAYIRRAKETGKLKSYSDLIK